ncbi:Conserved hypothetical, protein [Geosmithia morbida]|uniref:Conserved hypothetical, protein n=1 Tax=Geosmithia morbida TaxID=1094350 RepID=A0A9P4Z3H2_9HYPO|nr:Conserved hypothetical, protein [Geosmithia morbida]KAF4127015.1 Conserved hypothetical, protein [Geosmithia morbida]
MRYEDWDILLFPQDSKVPVKEFKISIHSWNDFPPISQYTKSYSKYSETVKFEARLFIDGRFIACVGPG